MITISKIVGILFFLVVITGSSDAGNKILDHKFKPGEAITVEHLAKEFPEGSEYIDDKNFFEPSVYDQIWAWLLVIGFFFVVSSSPISQIIGWIMWIIFIIMVFMQ